jgi:hypothetical protein
VLTMPLKVLTFAGRALKMRRRFGEFAGEEATRDV